MSSIPAAALPVFFFLAVAAAELLVSTLLRKHTHRLSDTVTSIFMGLSMMLYTTLYASGAFVIYTFCYSHFHLFELRPDSLITFLIGMLLFDFLSYWYHVIEHKVNFMWASHATHHHSEDFNLTTAFRQPITGGSLSWVFFAPIAFVGVPPEIMLACNTIHLAYQFLVHTKLLPNLGFLDFIFITPSNHSVHHASNEEYIDKNFGSILVVWDLLFKTYAREDKGIKIYYGVTRSAKSFNTLWLNTVVYKNILDRMLNAGSFKQAMIALFGAPYDPNSIDAPDTSTGYVFNPKLNGFLTSYIVLQGFLVTAAGIGLYWLQGNSPALQVGFGFVIVVLSMVNVGKLMEADDRYLWIEITKFAVILAVFASGVMQWNLPMTIFVYTWCGISLLMLIPYASTHRQSKPALS